VDTLCRVYADIMGEKREDVQGLITFVKDRPGHDRRYAIDSSRIREELGLNHSIGFESGIKKTVWWYLQHIEWVNTVRSGEYRRWIDKNYEQR
jgi:dTDP-glucose 4,6-dehydratase